MGQAETKISNVTTTSSPNIQQLAFKIKSGQISNIIVMMGAGASTSANIPDFRTPGTGLYSNLEKYNLPTPESIFTLSYYREHPEAFYSLAKDLYPGKFKPTKAHDFIKFLADRKCLLRCYTQNIDGLEAIAGVPSNLIVQAHGGFSSAHCIDCKKEQDVDLMKKAIDDGIIMHCSSCGGLTKPGIVFFGEALPADFDHCKEKDFWKCDLLIVMGTSLTVQPFASLIGKVPIKCPRVLINRELCGMEIDSIGSNNGFLFGREGNTRDVFVQSSCDEGVEQLKSIIIA